MRHVESSHRLLIAYSGGLDSTALLHLLAKLRAEGRLLNPIAAFHVHHGLSPHADAWQKFCAETCRSLEVPFSSVPVTVPTPKGQGLEAAARRARYAAFERQSADWILLAHHRDDQAETVLFNLLRGAGVSGAAGMRERNGRYLRPLLSVGRDALHTWAVERGLSWVEDESNRDLRHARNFLRHEVLPVIERRFPAARRRLAAAASRFAAAAMLLDDLARLDLGKESDFPLSVARLTDLPALRAANVLRYLLQARGCLIPAGERLYEAVRQLCSARSDRHPSLVFGPFRLVRRQGLICLEPVEK